MSEDDGQRCSANVGAYLDACDALDCRPAEFVADEGEVVVEEVAVGDAAHEDDTTHCLVAGTDEIPDSVNRTGKGIGEWTGCGECRPTENRSL